MRLYDDIATGRRVLTRNIARTLVMAHEHEAFHVEVNIFSSPLFVIVANLLFQTLLYMLIQRTGSGSLPPGGFVVPPWDDLAGQWASVPPPLSSTVLVGPATVTLGHQDSEGDDRVPQLAEDVVGHTFGWDNESPPRAMQVGQFKAEWRLVTNGEFEVFWMGPGKDLVEMPKSWVDDDSGIKVCLLIVFHFSS